MDSLATLVGKWPVGEAAVAVTDEESTLATAGDINWSVRTASISKTMVGLTALVALEEESIQLDDPAGPQGATVRHLLAHASGLALDDNRQLAAPGTERIYSNAGIEQFAAYLATTTEMPFEQYLREAVFEPLQMNATELVGSPAHGVYSTIDDLLMFARELLAPTLVAGSTLRDARVAHFPELQGALPGVGSFDPNPWGLTFEVRGEKDPHWMGRNNSPETFGHFGGSGSFLWVDPVAGIAAIGLSDREYDGWGMEVWPEFSDTVLARYGGG